MWLSEHKNDLMRFVADSPILSAAVKMVYSEVTKACTCGISMCIKIPYRTARFCWRTQVYIVCLPFRCTYRILHLIKCQVVTLVCYPNRIGAKTLLQNFMQCDISEKEKVLIAMREFRTSSLIAVTKMNLLTRELGKCRQQLACWKIHAGRHTKHMEDIVNEERELLRLILGALRRLKSLKMSRESADEKLKSTLEGLMNITKNLSSKEFNEYSNECPAAEINAALKTGYNRLQRQSEQIRNVIEKKRDYINFCCREDNSDIFFKKSSNGCVTSEVENTSNMLGLSVGTLDTIFSLLNAENLQLKKRLKVTNDQLDDVKNTSTSFNDKITHLEQQLDVVICLLRNVEDDRDNMREKLLTLRGMIEEEEIFLNDDFAADDCFNELYMASKEFNSTELESLSTSPSGLMDTFSETGEVKFPKSADPSLSR